MNMKAELQQEHKQEHGQHKVAHLTTLHLFTHLECKFQANHEREANGI